MSSKLVPVQFLTFTINILAMYTHHIAHVGSPYRSPDCSFSKVSLSFSAAQAKVSSARRCRSAPPIPNFIATTFDGQHAQ